MLENKTWSIVKRLLIKILLIANGYLQLKMTKSAIL